MRDDTETLWQVFIDSFKKSYASTGLRKRLQQERRRILLQLLADILMVTASMSFLVATLLNLYLR